MVRVYVGGAEQWQTMPMKEVGRERQFLFQGVLCSFELGGILSQVEGVDEKRVCTALEDDDPNNRRDPGPDDAVLVLAPTGLGRFRALRDLRGGEHVCFQSRCYQTVVENDWLKIRFTGEVLKRVTRTFTRTTDSIVELTLRDSAGHESTIKGTPEHPFFVPAVDDYVPMGKLAVGTVLETSTSSETVATVASTNRIYGKFVVHNLEVEGLHTYYVSAPGGGPSVLVHNTCQVNIRQDALGRVKSAFAEITPADLGAGTSTNAATRAAARAAGMATDDAGHLIGRALGGPGGVNARNFVPQDLSVNRGIFRAFEQRVAAEVEAGNQVFVRVSPQYVGPATRPNEILYQVRVNGTSWAPQRFPN